MGSLFKEEKYESRSWGEIAYDFFDIFRFKIDEAVRRQQRKFWKISVSIACVVIGLLFFLNGLAGFIGKLINDSSWSGYLTVGSVLIIVGALLPKN